MAGEAAWLSCYGGGWPLMFPNAGDACVADGARHGFLGEASVSPWAVTGCGPHGLTLRCRFLSVSVTMPYKVALAARDVASLAYGRADLRTALVTTAAKFPGQTEEADRPFIGDLLSFRAKVRSLAEPLLAPD